MSKVQERALEAYPQMIVAEQIVPNATVVNFTPRLIDLNAFQRMKYQEGYQQALKDIEKEIEHRTLNAHEMPDSAKDKEFYCGMDAAFSDIMVYIDSLND